MEWVIVRKEQVEAILRKTKEIEEKMKVIQREYLLMKEKHFLTNKRKEK